MKYRSEVLVSGMKRLAAKHPELRDDLASLLRKARFEEGTKMTVEEMQKYLEEGGNPEAAEQWGENHDKYQDVVKELAAKRAHLQKIHRALGKA
jgi:hypothetical protein